MHYMAQPISFRWDEDYIARIDAARGDMKRSAFVRAAVDRVLDAPTPSRPATAPGTTARGRQPRVTHDKRTGPVPIAPASHPDDVRVLDPEPMRRVRTAPIVRHGMTCKCGVCRPVKGGK